MLTFPATEALADTASRKLHLPPVLLCAYNGWHSSARCHWGLGRLPRRCTSLSAAISSTDITILHAITSCSPPSIGVKDEGHPVCKVIGLSCYRAMAL